MKRLLSSLASFNGLLLVAVFFCSLAFTSVCLHHPDDNPKLFRIPRIQGSPKATTCLAPAYMMNAWYHIELLRPFSDSLVLPDENERLKYPEFYEDHTDGQPEEFSNEGLVVIADTVNEISMIKRPIWASYLFHRSFNDKRMVLQDDTLIREVKSFPIYIANVSATKTANLETQDASVMMILQAQDDKHQWRDIEYWSHSWCGNSYFTLNIPPQHFAFTRGIQCSGDYNTLCRLKVYNRQDSLLSNTFRMNISKTQFERPVGE